MNVEWVKPVATELLVIRMSRPFTAESAANWVMKAESESDAQTYINLPEWRALYELVCGFPSV